MDACDKSDSSYDLAARERSNTWPSSYAGHHQQRHFAAVNCAIDPYNHFSYSPTYSPLNSSQCSSALGLSLISESNESLASAGSSNHIATVDENNAVTISAGTTLTGSGDSSSLTPLGQRPFHANSTNVSRPVHLIHQPMTYRAGHPSYVELITQAILTSPEQRMTLAEIYDWMVNNVDAFKNQRNMHSSTGWKNSVRHNLSLHSRFKRVKRNGLDKPSWWTVDLSNEAKRYRPNTAGSTKHHRNLKTCSSSATSPKNSSSFADHVSKNNAVPVKFYTEQGTNSSTCAGTATTSSDSLYSSPSSSIVMSRGDSSVSTYHSSTSSEQLMLTDDDFVASAVGNNCSNKSDGDKHFLIAEQHQQQTSLRDLLSSSYKPNNADAYPNEDHCTSSLSSGLVQAITAGLNADDCSQYTSNFWPCCSPFTYASYARDLADNNAEQQQQQSQIRQQRKSNGSDQMYNCVQKTANIPCKLEDREQMLRVKMMSGNEQNVSVPTPVPLKIVVQTEKYCQTESEDLNQNLRRQLILNGCGSSASTNNFRAAAQSSQLCPEPFLTAALMSNHNLPQQSDQLHQASTSETTSFFRQTVDDRKVNEVHRAVAGDSFVLNGNCFEFDSASLMDRKAHCSGQPVGNSAASFGDNLSGTKEHDHEQIGAVSQLWTAWLKSVDDALEYPPALYLAN